MRYRRLKQLRNQLMMKAQKTQEDEELLQELISLSSILDTEKFSLSISSQVCPSCGRPFDK